MGNRQIDMLKPDFFNFTNTAKGMLGHLNHDDAVTASSGTDLLATTLNITAHGFSAGSHILITDTTNYDGVQLIHSVAANSMVIKAPYVAEHFANLTSHYGVGVKYDCEYYFMGFKLHLSAAATTDENFQVAIDSDVASTHDTLIYSHTVQGVTDIIYSPSEPVLCGKKDIVRCTWLNTDAVNWGITLIAARLV